MNFRQAAADDLAELAALFHQSVVLLAPAHYSPIQVERWAGLALDLDAFSRVLAAAYILVAEDGRGIVGFAGLENSGHLSMLYVRPDAGRQGVGSSLLQALTERARSLGLTRLYAEASALSLPVFLRCGYVQCGEETVERAGVSFTRALVEALI